MENCYEQLNTEFVETRKVSFLTKLVSTPLSLTLISTPLVEIIPGFQYIYNMYYLCNYGFGSTVIGYCYSNCFPFF